ncbi:MAG: 5-(carboxyamino)imidazole ribonucleotide mutase [Clostridia bacterium]|jgi:5-(carboxyamino)imidazole ribonucleotide mutase|nr:5-(carboxyamino)imidazole ribonucleotide mutase [Clostridia bacterium]MDD4571498.1 5-(carboxyamino)imidazole ribonucleotide mutase [Clostridia bacterium]
MGVDNSSLLNSNKVMVVMGSDSDLPVVKAAVDFLEEMAIPFEVHVSSAHRAAAKTETLAKNAVANGFAVIIAAAGGAAHLAGVIAAQTTLPVIGIPVKSGALQGMDALYATVQMPPGIPVATVAIDGARNAAILAAQILGITDRQISEKIAALKNKMAEDIEKKDTKLQSLGVAEYLAQK